MLGTLEMERLCVEQLGGEPWFFFEHQPRSIQQNIATSVYSPSYEYLDHSEYVVRRFVGGKGWDKEAKVFAETWPPMYVQGNSWEDCAHQLGLQVPATTGIQ